ncbi:MAG: hypothetical protein KA603_08055 [Azonexus sp.]|jgi:hypothetical protein|nr:hypothetical protein [Betaproteobacteria bacterium]MBK8916973.1 hypothetical protein [Betaproteobacteria bacterium]MBP6036070.1 hypothetical protein [Azonexus sp.]MBP6906593.1 hypothetical protein [Azonexus sp.]
MNPKTEDIRWLRPDGSVVSCTEKIKVLRENLAELRQVAQDSFEDALLMECSEEQIRAVFQELIASLENPYQP